MIKGEHGGVQRRGSKTGEWRGTRRVEGHDKHIQGRREGQSVMIVGGVDDNGGDVSSKQSSNQTTKSVSNQVSYQPSNQVTM